MDTRTPTDRTTPKRRQRARPALLCALLTIALGAGSAAEAACTFGSSREPTLQSIFDTYLPQGTLDAAADCLPDGDDSVWSITQGIATIVEEITGKRRVNSFGLYDALDPANRITLFHGADVPGAARRFELRPGSGGYEVYVDQHHLGTFAGPRYGFFLFDGKSSLIFSDSARNGGSADHLYAYRGLAAQTESQGTPRATFDFTMDFFLLGLEDWNGPRSDRDFQDLVVLLQFVAPVPLPGSVWLLLSAAGLFGAWRARRRALTAG